MTFQVEEISFEKAWRVIHAMQTDKVFDNWIIIVRFSCHVNNKTILDNIKNYNYPRPIIKKLKAPLLYYLLPRPNCFCLYDTHLKNIYYLAKSCSLFLQFEILFIDKGKDYDLKKKYFTGRTALYWLFKNQRQGRKIFFLPIRYRQSSFCKQYQPSNRLQFCTRLSASLLPAASVGWVFNPTGLRPSECWVSDPTYYFFVL